MNEFNPLDLVPWDCPESMRMREAAERMARAEENPGPPRLRWNPVLIVQMAMIGARSPKHALALIELCAAAVDLLAALSAWNGGVEPPEVAEQVEQLRLGRS